MRIATIVGARPQFIKAAAVSRELRKDNEEVLIHTGQHFDRNMSKVFFEELGLPIPDLNLGINGGSNTKQVARMLLKLHEELKGINPDIVLVYGDTNSTLAGALSAAQLNIPVAHVEAGLRSFRMSMPEEQNRVVTDAISALLFCPTKNAVEQLRREGKRTGVYYTGDVMYDTILEFISKSRGRINYEKLGVRPKRYHLLTLHRAENTDDKNKLLRILRGIQKSRNPVVFPMHPRTKKAIQRYGVQKEITKVFRIIEPVGYLEMIELERNAARIITDSGGVQKEAYFLKVPCITLRNETEWIETVKDGWNILAGADDKKIGESINTFEAKGKQHSAFGDGKAGKKIAKAIKNFGRQKKCAE